ncbi:hypothetical protein C9382_07725 [Pseudomonas aylmerensis]|uniref:Uncharacterized protein n=1 Tax=Pseudomonas aylmerensis TaxID=1869229 RepID=A0A2T4G5N9_9PSED|nr:hypothetical protein C9382_07725 [Pseudomonas aylmerensis]
MRFIRTMKRNTGTREKMWAGHTAPFFCLQESESRHPETQKGPQGAFLEGGDAISVRGPQSYLSCHPTLPHPASGLYVR